MTTKGRAVIGLKVVTIDTGTVIANVKELVYDPTSHRIVALLVSKGGLFARTRAIAMDDVRNIGIDAVIVSNEAAMTAIKRLDDATKAIARSSKHLVRTNVLTIEGKALGSVTDVYLNSATGYAETLEVSQGGLKTMTEGKKAIKPQDVITIGADATIVSAYTELAFEAQGEAAGLKGALNDMKSKRDQLVADTSDAVQGAVDRTVAASGELADTARTQSTTLTAKARRAARQASDRLDAEVGAAVAATKRSGKTVARTTSRRTSRGGQVVKAETVTVKR